MLFDGRDNNQVAMILGDINSFGEQIRFPPSLSARAPSLAVVARP